MRPSNVLLTQFVLHYSLQVGVCTGDTWRDARRACRIARLRLQHLPKQHVVPRVWLCVQLLSEGIAMDGRQRRCGTAVCGELRQVWHPARILFVDSMH